MTPEQNAIRWQIRYNCIEHLYLNKMMSLYPSSDRLALLNIIRESCEEYLKEKGYHYPRNDAEK